MHMRVLVSINKQTAKIDVFGSIKRLAKDLKLNKSELYDTLSRGKDEWENAEYFIKRTFIKTTMYKKHKL